MEFRHLGRSGLMVSEISYGNWITHGSQVEEDAALACVRAALDAGITTFDTADVYAGTRAEDVLGRALQGERREGLEIFTKVYWPTGPGRNDRGLSRKHIMESINGSLRRLQTDYVDLYQAHRYDYSTPLEETMEAFADVVHSGKALYIGVSEWTRRRRSAPATRSPGSCSIPLVSNQPQYSMLWRVIEAEVVPASEELGIGQIVWSPIAQGVLTGKYLPGQPPPAGSRATDEKSGAGFIARFMSDDVLTAVQQLKPLAEQAGLTHGPARRGLGAAEPERLLGDHRRVPARAGARQRQGGRGEARRRPAQGDRRRSSTRSSSATRPRPSPPRSVPDAVPARPARNLAPTGPGQVSPVAGSGRLCRSPVTARSGSAPGRWRRATTADRAGRRPRRPRRRTSRRCAGSTAARRAG